MSKNLKLTEKDIDGMKEWLNSSSEKKSMFCPFERDCYRTCCHIFPSLNTLKYCPCSKLTLDHIVKTCRNILKEK